MNVEESFCPDPWWNTWLGKIAHLLTCLLYSHEDLSSDPQEP